MSTHPPSKSEKSAPKDGGSAQRKSDLAKEFKRTEAGVWDVYEQIPHNKFGFSIPWISRLTRNLQIVKEFPLIWKVVKDVANIKSCRYYLFLYILVKFLLSFQPAVALWCVALRVMSICYIPNTQRSGSPVTTSPLFVFYFLHPLSVPNRSPRFK